MTNTPRSPYPANPNPSLRDDVPGKNRMDRVFLFIGTSFGLAYLPVAPGTWGALPGVAIYLLIAMCAQPGSHTLLIGLALFLVSVVTIALSPWAERYWKTKDPKKYVPDEVAGFLVTVLLFRTPDPLLTSIWAFLVTRFFDIAKFPPARQLESLPAGWGILLDDVASSLYAALALNLAAMLWPYLFGGMPFLVSAW